jgi:CRISPR/Cas system CMR subunit Cmr6 (Cas7 group RAMP superfamily)
MIKVFLSEDVRTCVRADAAAVHNRCLRFAKFPAMSDSREDKEWRKNLLEQIMKVPADPAGLRVRPVTPPGAMSFPLRLCADMVVNHAVGVVENSGLALDRHFGHPYIPGSALKGIAQVGAALCEATLRERQLVFGWAPRNGDEGLPENAPNAFAGSVVFFAAHPLREAPLRVDIVNCHHMRYYQAGGSRPATDDESPNPQFFWVVKAGAEFQFVLAPVASDRTAAMKERLGLPADFDPLAKAREWLTRGLTEHGIGAKTAAGYGWFTQGGADDGARVPAEHAAAPAASDFNERIFANVLKLADNKGQWQNLRAHIEKLKRPENASWLAKFKAATGGADYKELRKQDWYPR